MADEPDQLREVLKERAVELYNLCDQDGKGHVTKLELERVIAELGLPLDSTQIDQSFNELDEDQNGYLTLEEFTAGFGLFLGIHTDEDGNSELEELTTLSDPGRELFYLCDPQNKGFITKDDLQRVAGDLNLNFEQLDVIFDKLDIDKNGRLTLDEFAEGFGKFLGHSNDDPTQVNTSKHDNCTNSDLIKPELPEGNDIFESLEAGRSSPNQSAEDVLFREIVENVGEDIFSG